MLSASDQPSGVGCVAGYGPVPGPGALYHGYGPAALGPPPGCHPGAPPEPSASSWPTSGPGWFQSEGPPGSGKSSFVCKGCGKSYLHHSSVHKHIRFECGKEPQFKCTFCPHRSKLKSNLKKHLRNSHNYP